MNSTNNSTPPNSPGLRDLQGSLTANTSNSYDPKVQQALDTITNRLRVDEIVKFLAGSNKEKLAAGKMLEENGHHDAAYVIYLPLVNAEDEAAYRVGLMCKEGRGVEEDWSEAKKFFELSNLDRAKYEILHMSYMSPYYFIEDIEKPVPEAFRQFQCSIKQADETINAELTTLLGFLMAVKHPHVEGWYQYGSYSYSCPSRMEFAKGHLYKATTLGSAEAHFELGKLYYQDDNPEDAVFHLEKFLKRNSTQTAFSRIAKLKLVEAHSYLGNIYCKGYDGYRRSTPDSADSVKAFSHYKCVIDLCVNDLLINIEPKYNKLIKQLVRNAEDQCNKRIVQLRSNLTNQQAVNFNINTTVTDSGESKNKKETGCSVM